jgi:thermostable 8-oxoguanine DNA glycosylase
MLIDTPPPNVSLNDIRRVHKQAEDIREELRRCMSRVEASRNAGHLIDNTVRESFRLSTSLKNIEARLQNLKTRRAESRTTRAAEAAHETSIRT